MRGSERQTAVANQQRPLQVPTKRQQRKTPTEPPDVA
jgi:hypothetical protein